MASIQMLISAGGKKKHSIIKPSVKLIFSFFTWGKKHLSQLHSDLKQQ